VFVVSATNSGIETQQPSASDIKFAKQAAQKLNLEEVHNIAKELEFITGKLPAVGEGCKDCGSEIQNIPNKEVTLEDGIIVFVSFSMPKASLMKLGDQSQKYKATLVLRGIHEDSFLKTKDKILEINPKGLQLQIHPDLFRQYNIKRVPTFVLVKNGMEINRLSGNVTLEFAHSKLSEEP
jgi:type-F conjugative transfer system pilin assembly protein TrbC